MTNGIKSTVLWTALVLVAGLSVTACSSDKEAGAESGEVLAVDRVDDAAKLARENAPEAEDMDFPETAPMSVTDVATDGTTTDGTATDGTATDGTAMDATATEAGATAAETSDTTPAENATTEATVASTDGTEAPAAEPATN